MYLFLFTYQIVHDYENVFIGLIIILSYANCLDHQPIVDRKSDNSMSNEIMLNKASVDNDEEFVQKATDKIDCPNHLEPESHRKIFINNLSFNVTHETCLSYLSQFGDVSVSN